MSIKVQKYISNIGKSVAYTTKDVVFKNFDYAESLVNENKELLNNSYSSLKDTKGLANRFKKYVSGTGVFDAAKEAVGSVKYSLSTGDIYGKAYQDQKAMQYGGDLTDFSEFDKYDIESPDFNFNNDDIDEGDKVVATAVTKSSKKNTAVTVEAIIQGAKAQVSATQDATSVIYAQQEKMINKLNSGFGSMMDFMTKNAQQTNKIQQQQNENMNNFMTHVDNNVAKITAQLDELIQMQRNLYQSQTDQQEKDKRQSHYDKIFGGGSFNLKAYGGNVKNNVITALDEMGGIGTQVQNLLNSSKNGGQNQLAVLAASLPQLGLEAGINRLMGDQIKKSLSSLNDTLESAIPTVFAGLTNWGRTQNNGIQGLLGRLLGVKPNAPEDINTGKYNKGPTPFDGITKRTITDVIPYYLSKMTASMTGIEEVYDYNNGKFIKIKDAIKTANEQLHPETDIANSILKTISKGLGNNKGIISGNKDKQSDYEKAAERLSQQIQSNNIGDIVSMLNMLTNNPESNNDDIELLRLLIATLNNNNKSGGNRGKNFVQFNQDIRKSVNNARITRNNVSQGLDSNSILRQLLGRNDIDLDTSFTAGKSAGKGLAQNSMTATASVLNAKDSYGETLYSYLHNISEDLISFNNNFVNYIGSTNVKKGKRHRRSLDGGLSRSYVQNASVGSITQISETPKLSEGEYALDDNINIEDMSLEEIQKYLNDHTRYNDEKQPVDEKGHPIKGVAGQFKEVTGSISKGIDTATTKLVDSMFKLFSEPNPNDDANVKKLSGIERIRVTLNTGFTKITDKLQDFAKSTWDRIKSWWEDSSLNAKLFGEKDEEGVRRGGLFGNFIGEVQYDWHKIKGDVKQETTNTINDIKSKAKKWTSSDDIKSSAVGGINKTGKSIRSAISAGEYLNGNLIHQTGIYDIPPEGVVVNPADKATRNKQKANETSLINSLKHNADANEGLITSTSQVKDLITTAEPRGKDYILKQNGKQYTIPANMLERLQKAETIDQKDIDYLNKYAEDDFNGYYSSGKVSMGKVATHAGIGAAAGLLVGGPVIGAAIGAVSGMSNSANAFSNAIFGEAIKDENGNVVYDDEGKIKRNYDGIISESLQKACPTMLKGGGIGAIAGMLTPLGPIGGLIAGSAIGYASKSQTVQNILFGGDGEEGIFGNGGKEQMDKLKGDIKKHGKGMGVGAVLGAFTGPFGLIGNAVLGAGVGYVTTSDKFRDAILGKEDENGKRQGGIIGALKTRLVNPLTNFGKDLTAAITDSIFGTKDENGKREGGIIGYALKNIIDPLSEGIKPMIQGFKNMFSTDRNSFISRIINRVAGPDSAGKDTLGAIVDRVGKMITSPIRGGVSAATHVLGAPLALGARGVRAAGNKIRKGQIKKGKANDMTAQERSDFRQAHGMALSGENADQFAQFDEYLIAGEQSGSNSIEDLENLRAAIRYQTEGEEGVKKDLKDDRNQLGKYLGTVLQAKSRNKIIEYINGGHADKAINYISSGKCMGRDRKAISPEIAAQIIEKINGPGGYLEKETNAFARYNNAKRAGGVTSEQLEKFGLKDIDLGDKNSVAALTGILDTQINHMKNDPEAEEKKRKSFFIGDNGVFKPITELLEEIKNSIQDSDDFSSKDIKGMKHFNKEDIEKRWNLLSDEAKAQYNNNFDEYYQTQIKDVAGDTEGIKDKLSNGPKILSGKDIHTMNSKNYLDKYMQEFAENNNMSVEELQAQLDKSSALQSKFSDYAISQRTKESKRNIKLMRGKRVKKTTSENTNDAGGKEGTGPDDDDDTQVKTQNTGKGLFGKVKNFFGSKKQQKTQDKELQAYNDAGGKEGTGLDFDDWVKIQNTGGLFGKVKNLFDLKEKQKKEKTSQEEWQEEVLKKMDKLEKKEEKPKIVEDKWAKLIKLVVKSAIIVPLVTGFIKDKICPAIKDKLQPWLTDTLMPKLVGTKDANGEYQGGWISGIVNPIKNYFGDKFQKVKEWVTNTGEYADEDKGMSGMILKFKNMLVSTKDMWMDGFNVIKEALFNVYEKTLEYLPSLLWQVLKSTAKGLVSMIKNLFHIGKNKDTSSNANTDDGLTTFSDNTIYEDELGNQYYLSDDGEYFSTDYVEDNNQLGQSGDYNSLDNYSQDNRVDDVAGSFIKGSIVKQGAKETFGNTKVVKKISTGVAKATEAVGKATNSKAVKTVGKVASKAGKVISKVPGAGLATKGVKVSSKIVKGSVKATKAIGKAQSATGEAISKVASGEGSSIIKKISDSLSDLLGKLFKNSSFQKKAAEAGAQEVGEEAGKKAAKEITSGLGEKAGAQIAKEAGKGVAKSACFVIGIAMAVADFLIGWNNAANVLGILNDDLTTPMKLIAGILKASEDIPYVGIIIALFADKWRDLFLNVLGPILFPDTYEDIIERQEEAEATVNEYNEEHGTSLDIESYNKIFSPTNTQKVSNWVSDKTSSLFGKDKAAENAINNSTNIEAGNKKIKKIKKKLSDVGSAVWETFWRRFMFAEDDSMTESQNEAVNKQTFGEAWGHMTDGLVAMLNENFGTDNDSAILEKIKTNIKKYDHGDDQYDKDEKKKQNVFKSFWSGVTSGFGLVGGLVKAVSGSRAKKLIAAFEAGYNDPADTLGIKGDPSEQAYAISGITSLICEIFKPYTESAKVHPNDIKDICVATLYEVFCSGTDAEEDSELSTVASAAQKSTAYESYQTQLSSGLESSDDDEDSDYDADYDDEDYDDEDYATNADANDKLSPLGSNKKLSSRDKKLSKYDILLEIKNLLDSKLSSIDSKLGGALTGGGTDSNLNSDLSIGGILSDVSENTSNGTDIPDELAKLYKENSLVNDKINNLEITPSDKQFWEIKTESSKNTIAKSLFTIKENLNRLVKAPFVLSVLENTAFTNDIIDDTEDSSGKGISDIDNINAVTNRVIKSVSTTSSYYDKKHSSGNGKYGKGDSDPYHIYQRDYNGSFNISGDTEHQSVADSGCGPAAAASILRMYGKDGNMSNAVSYALHNNYKEQNGGTYPEYFKDYLGQNGIKTDSNISNTDVVKSLAENKPVVLMGRNTNGSNDVPYGTEYSHYVVAKGLDSNGNVIVEDSEDEIGNTRYNLADTLRNTSVKIATGRAKFGRGSDDTVGSNYIGDVSGSTTKALSALVYKFKSLLPTNITTSTDNESSTTTNSANVSISNSNNKESNEAQIWKFYTSNGFSDYLTAAIMGNMARESGYDPDVAQGQTGYNHDKNDITEIPAASGYGLIQMTNDYNHAALYNFCEANGYDYHDLEGQCTLVLQYFKNESGELDKCVNADNASFFGGEDGSGCCQIVPTYLKNHGDTLGIGTTFTEWNSSTDIESLNALIYDSYEVGADRSGDIAKSLAVANELLSKYSSGSGRGSGVLDRYISKNGDNNYTKRLKDNASRLANLSGSTSNSGKGKLSRKRKTGLGRRTNRLGRGIRRRGNGLYTRYGRGKGFNNRIHRRYGRGRYGRANYVRNYDNDYVESYNKTNYADIFVDADGNYYLDAESSGISMDDSSYFWVSPDGSVVDLSLCDDMDIDTLISERSGDDSIENKIEEAGGILNYKFTKSELKNFLSCYDNGTFDVGEYANTDTGVLYEALNEAFNDNRGNSTIGEFLMEYFDYGTSGDSTSADTVNELIQLQTEEEANESSESFISLLGSYTTELLKALYGTDVYEAVFGKDTSDENTVTSISSTGNKGYFIAMASVATEAFCVGDMQYTLNNGGGGDSDSSTPNQSSYTYNQGAFTTVELSTGEIFDNVRLDCTGLMSLIIWSMGGYSAGGTYSEHSHGDPWCSSTISASAIYDKDGNKSSDWKDINITSITDPDLQMGDILVYNGHAEMFLGLQASGCAGTYDNWDEMVIANNGTTPSKFNVLKYNAGSCGGMDRSYNIAEYYLTNGEFPSYSTLLEKSSSMTTQYPTSSDPFKFVIRYVGDNANLIYDEYSDESSEEAEEAEGKGRFGRGRGRSGKGNSSKVKDALNSYRKHKSTTYVDYNTLTRKLANKNDNTSHTLDFGELEPTKQSRSRKIMNQIRNEESASGRGKGTKTLIRTGKGQHSHNAPTLQSYDTLVHNGGKGKISSQSSSHTSSAGSYSSSHTSSAGSYSSSGLGVSPYYDARGVSYNPAPYLTGRGVNSSITGNSSGYGYYEQQQQQNATSAINTTAAIRSMSQQSSMNIQSVLKLVQLVVDNTDKIDSVIELLGAIATNTNGLSDTANQISTNTTSSNRDSTALSNLSRVLDNGSSGEDIANAVYQIVRK